MEDAPLVVCVTGAAGQIGYSLVPLVASGQIFGERKVILRMLDIPPMEMNLSGLKMELEDGAWPTLAGVEYGSDPMIMLKEVDVALFVGGFPRKAGMERKDLLAKNVDIFKVQGKALNEVGKKTTKILVVANPANTNCLTLMKNCPNIPPENFSALTRLDHNRAKAQLALKAQVPVGKVKNAIIWGNHSGTQYPDINQATIDGKKVIEVITDKEWLQGEFITKVQKRGAAIIEARKFSSALSAANAVKDHIRSWMFGTQEGEHVSMAVITNGKWYGIPAGLCFSLPVVCKDFKYEVVEGIEWDEFSKTKIAATQKELLEERTEAGLE